MAVKVVHKCAKMHSLSWVKLTFAVVIFQGIEMGQRKTDSTKRKNRGLYLWWQQEVPTKSFFFVRRPMSVLTTLNDSNFWSKDQFSIYSVGNLVGPQTYFRTRWHSGKFRNFLSFRFYVKSSFENLESKLWNYSFCHFLGL